MTAIMDQQLELDSKALMFIAEVRFKSSFTVRSLARSLKMKQWQQQQRRSTSAFHGLAYLPTDIDRGS